MFMVEIDTERVCMHVCSEAINKSIQIDDVYIIYQYVYKFIKSALQLITQAVYMLM